MVEDRRHRLTSAVARLYFGQQLDLAHTELIEQLFAEQVLPTALGS
jgi:hypothetical protein